MVVGVGFGVFGCRGLDGAELADFEVEDGAVPFERAGLEAERTGGRGESRDDSRIGSGLEGDVGIVGSKTGGGRDLVICSNQSQSGVGETGSG